MHVSMNVSTEVGAAAEKAKSIGYASASMDFPMWDADTEIYSRQSTFNQRRF